MSETAPQLYFHTRKSTPHSYLKISLMLDWDNLLKYETWSSKCEIHGHIQIDVRSKSKCLCVTLRNISIEFCDQGQELSLL